MSRSAWVVLAFSLFLWAAPASAQLQVATIRGIVTDAQKQPLAQASVLLKDLEEVTVKTAVTSTDGSFAIADVAPGSYVVRVELRGTLLLTRALVVRGSLPVQLTLQAGPTIHEDVVVRGDAASNTPEHPWSLSGDAVRRASAASPGQRVQSALATLPGWLAEDNGLLHVRGVDDGLLYVQDGIPVYERLDRLFGVAPNPAAIASVHVMNGYIPPEFGFKSGGVIEVRSESGLTRPWSGAFDAGVASFASRHVSALATGPLGKAGGLMLTAADERSSRFLDPVHPENFHNEGRSSSVSAQLTWRAGSNLFTASLQGGRNRYDVPHTQEQDEAGQDQRQRTEQMLGAASWQHAMSDRTIWQVSGYRRRSAATLRGSDADTPVTASGHRVVGRHGALWSATHQRGRHTIKTGGEVSLLRLDERFSFAVTDPDEGEDAGLSEEALHHDAANPFLFADRQRSSLWSGYVQDAIQFSSDLTINFGVRFDRSRLLLRASEWSPRIGASWLVRPGTTVRGAFLRLFQPPQAEYLLLASSPEARALSPFVDDVGSGGSSLPPERQSALEVSISQDLPGGWRSDVSTWWRRGRDVDDPNVFFGTTVTFPNSVASQHAWGLDMRVDMTPRRGWSASATYTYARVVQYGPITGGLFLEDEFLEIQEGTRFVPDHDQRHALQLITVFHDESRGLRLSGAFRFQTGTPVGLEDIDDLRGRAGAGVVDFASGRVRARAIVDTEAAWTIRRTGRVGATLVLWLENATGQTYAYNFGNPFSGTHFGAPRRAGVTVRATFR